MKTQTASTAPLFPRDAIKCGRGIAETRPERKEANKMDSNKPEKKITTGAISATIWQNVAKKDGKVTSYRTISLQRAYLDKDKKWQHTGSLRVNDLPKASLVLSKAYEYLVMKDSNDSQTAAMDELEEEIVI